MAGAGLYVATTSAAGLHPVWALTVDQVYRFHPGGPPAPMRPFVTPYTGEDRPRTVICVNTLEFEDRRARDDARSITTTTPPDAQVTLDQLRKRYGWNQEQLERARNTLGLQRFVRSGFRDGALWLQPRPFAYVLERDLQVWRDALRAINVDRILEE